RELEEEMGLRAREFLPLSEFQVAPGYSEERIWVYLARGLESCPQRLDDDEEVEVLRMPFAEALAMVHSGEIDDAKTIITLLLAAPLCAGA
ncbi:MAG TPA: NUDIX hydrolase, partial [Blastocatellia bacterium]